MAQRRFDSNDSPDTPGSGAEPVVERRLTRMTPPAKPATVQRASLPAPVKKAAAAVAIGAAVQVGGSLAMRYLASQAGKRTAGTLLAKGLKAAADNRSSASSRPVQRRDEPRRDIAEIEDDEPELVSEMLIVRRVWMRRHRD